ncbi:MAG: ABC transporter permease, partial [Cyclobacteriaceae bacterium]
MLTNYFKIAIRTLNRNKTYALINILGLTIGITCSCLLYLFINDELSYDAFHNQSDKLFRVIEVDRQGDSERYFGQTAPPVGEALVKDYPEVVATTRLFQPIGHIDTEWKGERMQERSYYMVESNFFQLFNFDFVNGNAIDAVSQANSLVMTESTAQKYFGDHNPVGEVMQFQNFDDATVAAVVKDLPSNSHLQFDLLITGNVMD